MTTLATGLLALALLAGALLLVQTLRRSLLSTVDSTALQRVEDVVTLVEQGRLPDVVPVSDGAAVVQVLDAEGRIVAASTTASRTVPLLSRAELAEARGRAPRTLDGGRIGDDLPVRVVVRDAAGGSTVLAGVSVGTLEESIRTVRVALAVGVPALLALLAATTWATVGSTLRPVAALRRGADAVTATEPSRRLPVPEARDEVYRLAVTLNGMLDRLQAAGESQRTFVADAAHEMRSPLTGMRSQLEVSLAHPQAEPWPKTAATVLEETLRLGRLVEDLLVLARVEGSTPPPRSEPLDLARLAREVAARQPPAVVEVVVSASTPVLVDGDEEALSRVVRNLLDNAVRHAAARVDVSVTAAPQWAELVVADDGPGIPVAERERVFDRFRRLDDARGRAAGGAGLGLPIVRQLVRAHGGDVAVHDADRGARLVVRLPFPARTAMP